MAGDTNWAIEQIRKQYEDNKQTKRKSTIHNDIGGKRKVLKGILGDLVFQVNPTTVEYGGGLNWTEINSPGRMTPQVQHGCGKSNTYSFELYVNEWMFDHKVNCDAFISKIFTYRASKKPVKFILGRMIHDVVVNEANIIIESYNPDMTKREARIQVTLTAVYKN